jgi:hypothetical protein
MREEPSEDNDLKKKLKSKIKLDDDEPVNEPKIEEEKKQEIP